MKFSRRKLLGGASFLLLGGWTHGGVSLEGIVGLVPANFNIVPWGAFWRYTNFSDSRFVLLNSSVTAGGFADLSNGFTAQKLIENASNAQHAVNTPTSDPDAIKMLSASAGIQYTVAAIAKAAERTRIVLTWQRLLDPTTPDTNTFASAGFDLAGGNAGYSNTSSTNMTCVSSSMTSLGGGYWLCKMNVLNNLPYPVTISDVYQVRINLDNGSGTGADSISYAGNGTSGAILWWFNMLPTAAWNIKTQAFFDDFNSLSTIDLTNSKAAGFNWYTNNTWANTSNNISPWSAGAAMPATAAANLSISSPSVLKIFNPNNNALGFTSTIWSACPTSGSGYIGNVFEPPCIFDAYVNYDGAFADYSANWGSSGFSSPAFWSTGIEVLTQNDLTTYTEWDVFESGPPNASNKTGSSAIHQFGNLAGPQTNHQYMTGINRVVLLGSFHRISGMWLPQSATGGYGIVLTFFDGTFTQEGDTAYSSSTVPQHGGSGGSAVGDIVFGETQHFPIILDTAENPTANVGGGWPFYIDWVKVYR